MTSVGFNRFNVSAGSGSGGAGPFLLVIAILILALGIYLINRTLKNREANTHLERNFK